ncbi:hypothetical protein FGB62_86g015 [Gracilaria domingensis]|nr:hypothetical protein FGB62_86g015 [Gracilaria domingensis]
MVFIPLTALQLALIVTFLVVVSELITVSVLFTILGVFETGVLQKGGSVSLSHHQRRLKYLTIVLTLAFVGLEVLFSLSSETAFEKISRGQTCTSLVPRSENASQEGDVDISNQEADVILSKCRTLNGTTFTQALGNFSLVSSNVSCADTSLYSFNASERVMRVLLDEKKECMELTIVGSSETVLSCIFYDFVDGILFLSTSRHPSGSAEGSEVEQEFLPTKLNFNASMSFIRGVARNVLQLYRPEVVVTDALTVRRVSFTTAVRRECNFEVGSKEGTKVPVYVIVIFVAIGAALLLASVGIVLVSRKRRFIDLSDPFIWIENYEDNFHSQNVQVQLSEEDGKLCLSGLVYHTSGHC